MRILCALILFVSLSLKAQQLNNPTWVVVTAATNTPDSGVTIIGEIPITTLITNVTIPVGSNVAFVTFYAWFIGDSAENFYRVDVKSYDINDDSVTSGWVSETYIPPMSETVTIALPVNAIRVESTISGPEPGVNTVWSDAKLTFWH